MNLRDMQTEYINEGYAPLMAAAKVCQDIILLAIANSKLKDNVTIKGGVVMHSLSKDKRRATQDIDFDFVHYPLSPEAITNFLRKISNEQFKIEPKGKIEQLKHQDYQGLRVHVEITDANNNVLSSKLDIGVHTHLDITQEEYCFIIQSQDEGLLLQVNSKEQIFVEKTKSFLKHGFRSTRFKDIFDLYFLCQEAGLNNDKLKSCMQRLIIEDDTMRENTFDDILARLKQTFYNRNFQRNFQSARNNWLDVSNDNAIAGIINYLEGAIL